MVEHQRPNGIPVTRFTLQSIYAQSDEEKLEFEYESGTTNIMVSWCIEVLMRSYMFGGCIDCSFVLYLIFQCKKMQELY